MAGDMSPEEQRLLFNDLIFLDCINTCRSEGARQALFSPDLEGDTWLHTSAANGFLYATEQLLRLAGDAVQQSLLLRDRQGNTPFMRAAKNADITLNTLLLGPLIEAKMSTRSLHVSNEALFAELRRVEEEKDSHSQIEVPPSLLEEAYRVADDYWKHGLTDTNCHNVQSFFSDQTSKVVLTAYEEKLKTAREEEKIKIQKDVTSFCQAKAKYIAHAALSGATEDSSIKTDSFTSILDSVEQFLDQGLTSTLLKGLADYIPAGVSTFLEIVKKIITEGQLSSSIEDLQNLVQPYADKSIYIALMAQMLPLATLHTTDAPDAFIAKVLPAMIEMGKIWARYFGGENEQHLMEKLSEKVKQISQHGANSTDQIYSFAGSFRTTAAQCALFVIALKPEIEKKIIDIAVFAASSDEVKAKHELFHLILRLLTETKVCSDDDTLKKALVDIIREISLAELKEYSEKKPLLLMACLFRQLHEKLDQLGLNEAVAILEEYANTPSYLASNIFLLINILSRSFIQYGADYENSSFSYAGVFGLIASTLYSMYQNTHQENQSMLQMIDALLKQTAGFLTGLHPLHSLAVFRLEAGIMFIEKILEATATLRKDWQKLSWGDCAGMLRKSFYELRIKLNILLKDHPDDVIKSITTAVKWTEGAFITVDFIGKGIDLITGKALESFLGKLRDNYPIIGALPFLGSMAENAGLKEEINKTKKEIITALSQQMIVMEQNLSSQINGVESDVQAIKSQLKDMQVQLNVIVSILCDIQESTTRSDIESFLAGVRTLKRSTKGIRNITSETRREIFKCFKKFFKHLIPANSGQDSISIYSKNITGWLGSLKQWIPEHNETKVPSDFLLWLDITKKLIRFLNRFEDDILLAENVGDELGIKSLDEVICRGKDLIGFFNGLTRHSIVEKFFESVLIQEVNLNALKLLASYCTLVGIPLTGYGEDVTLWTAKTPDGLAFRMAMKEKIVEHLPLLQTESPVRNARQVAQGIVITLGNAAIRLIDGYQEKFSGVERVLGKIERHNKFRKEIIESLSSLDKTGIPWEPMETTSTQMCCPMRP